MLKILDQISRLNHSIIIYYTIIVSFNDDVPFSNIIDVIISSEKPSSFNSLTGALHTNLAKLDNNFVYEDVLLKFTGN